jgi:type I restriction enzyme S subunit
MSTELPHGWREVPFGRLLSREKRTCGSDELPILSVTKDGIVLQLDHFKKQVASEDTSGYLRVRRGEVVTSALNLWMGGIDTQVLVDEGIVSPAYKVYRRVSDELDHEFMRHLIRSPVMMGLYREVSQQGASIVRRNVDFDRLHTSPIPLPPLAEQKKIAAILSSVDEAIRANEAVIEQTRRVKEGLLQELLTRGIGHTEFRETEIGPLPVGWDVRPLHQVCSRVGVGIASAATHAYSDKGVPLIRNQNIKPGRLDLSDLLYVTDWYDRENATKRLVAGDVLTIRTGYPGVSAVVPDSLDGAQSFTTLVSRPDSDLIDSSFLAAWINSPLGRGFVLRGKAGGAQHNLNSGTLRELRCPLPSLDEQKEIMFRLDAVASAEQRQEKAVERLRSLKSGLLQDLLTGKVRVTP